MGQYITFEQVRVRLISKVQFTESETDENKMNILLANRLISEAEGQVELDLSPRYLAPFQTSDGAAFGKLPDRPTKEVLTTICELQAVMKILDTDFGRGSAVDGSKYYEKLEQRYKNMVSKLLEMRDGYGSGWKYPPMPGLALNFQNAMADTGFTGSVLITGVGGDSDSYPSRRINNPAMTFWGWASGGWDNLE